MRIKDIPRVDDVWSVHRYQCACPVCHFCFNLAPVMFKYRKSIGLTGAVAECPSCGLACFVVQPEL